MSDNPDQLQLFTIEPHPTIYKERQEDDPGTNQTKETNE